jgi:hypothetical protein
MVENSKFFELLAGSVAIGSTVRKAAEMANCSESQAYRICSTVEFKSRVHEIRSEITEAAVGILTNAATEACSTLLALLHEDFEPAIRLNASKAILANLAAVSELGELRARLDALEQSQKTKLGITG